MLWGCDIMHSSVHTEYSLASVENLAASRRRIWWEKSNTSLVQPVYLQRTDRFFHFSKWTVSFLSWDCCFWQILFLLFSIVTFFSTGVVFLCFLMLFCILCSSPSNDINKRTLQWIPHPCFRKQYQEAFFQHVLSFHKEHLALGSGFLLYLPVQETYNFCFPT